MQKAYAMLLLFPVVVLRGHGQVTPAQCAALSETPPKADALLPMVNLTAVDIERIKKERTCIKSYEYPGGEDALLKATSSEFRADLQHLQDLFDKTPESTKDMSTSLKSA